MESILELSAVISASLIKSELISPVLFQMSGYGQDERRPPVTPLPDPEARGAWSPVMPMNHRSRSAPRWSQTGDKAGVRRDLGINYIEIRDAGAVLESIKR